MLRQLGTIESSKSEKPVVFSYSPICQEDLYSMSPFDSMGIRKFSLSFLKVLLDHSLLGYFKTFTVNVEHICRFLKRHFYAHVQNLLGPNPLYLF